MKKVIPMVAVGIVAFAILSATHHGQDEKPETKPAQEVEPCYHDEARTRPAMAEWLNHHPIETWPKTSGHPDMNAAADQVTTEVLVPLGCDPDSLLTSSEARDGLWDAWYAWVEAQPDGPWSDGVRPTDSGSGHAGCRMSFGTGGFHWSCSVSG